MNENLEDVQPNDSNPICYLDVRRSGRCRTVNSIYAESIGEMKKTNRKPITLKKPSHKLSFGEDQESDEYEMKPTL